MNENFKQLLEKFNNNPYSLSRDEVYKLQENLGFVENGKDNNKLDGWMGDDTIKAVQRFVGVKDDGIWGKNSRMSFQQNIANKLEAIKNPLNSNLIPQAGYLNNIGIPTANRNPENNQDKKTYDIDMFGENVSGTIDDWKNLAKKGWDWFWKGQKMSVGTSKDLADYGINKYTDYVTKDLGHDVSYNRGDIVYQKQNFEDTFNNTKQQFATESKQPFPGLGTPYASQYQGNSNQIMPQHYFDRLNNGDIRQNTKAVHDYFQKQLTTGKAILDVKNTEIKGNPEYTQTHLSTDDRKDWATELGLRTKYISELDTLRAEQDVNAYNSILPQNKFKYMTNSQILQDRMGLSMNTPKIKYIGSNEIHNPYPKQYKNLIDSIQNQAKQTGNLNLTEQQQNNLQYYYDTYGISPQYKFLPQREINLLDHLHAAGYSYKSKPETFEEITSKVSDALENKFTHRTYDGKGGSQSKFTFANSNRAGLTNHLNNRGENIGNKFNKELFEKPEFEISPTLAYDWSKGSYNVALQEKKPSSEYKLYVDVLKPYYNQLINLQEQDVEPMNKILSSLGFRDPEAMKFKKQLTTGKPNIRDFESGKRSAGHFTTTQNSNMGQPHYGAGRIQGVQMINGTPQWFDQDLYDIGDDITIGSGTYYKTPHKMTQNQINTAYKYFIKGEDE